MHKETLAQFIHAAAQETFAVMLGLPITESATKNEDLEEISVSERVVTLIGVTGDYNGTGLTTCSPALACRIASQMLMAEYSEMNKDVLDAMGEISNMIFGNVKTMLEDKLGLLGLTTPMVIFGRGFCMRTVNKQWVNISFQVEEESFDLQMCLAENRNSAKTEKVRIPAA